MTKNVLYNDTDIEMMQLADDARLIGKNRIVEIRNFARLSGLKRIGIANCVALQKETLQLKEMLSSDFEVYTVDCKCGKLAANEYLSTNTKGIMCNPAGQAEFLEKNHTELNIAMGLCLGHDMIFTSKSKAPVTTLIVKDREHKHNPIVSFNN